MGIYEYVYVCAGRPSTVEGNGVDLSFSLSSPSVLLNEANLLGLPERLDAMTGTRFNGGAGKPEPLAWAGRWEALVRGCGGGCQ